MIEVHEEPVRRHTSSLADSGNMEEKLTLSERSQFRRRDAENTAFGEVRDLIARLRQASELSDRLELILETVISQHGFQGAAICGWIQPGGRVRCLANRGLADAEQQAAARWTVNAAKSQTFRRSRAPFTRLSIPPAPTGRTAVVIPLLGRDRLLGSFVLLGPSAEERARHDVDTLTLLGSLASLFMEQSQYREEAESSREARLEQIETLAESGQALASGREITDICDNILAVLCGLFSARAGWIMLYNHDEGALNVATYRGLGRERLSHASIRPDSGIAGRVFRTRESVFVEDVQKDPLFVYRDAAVRAGLRPLLAVPLLVRSEAIGVLGVFLPALPRDGRERRWMMEAAEVFAGQAAAAIQNAQLYQRLEQAYERERRIAETFQHALLSDVPEHLDGIEVGHIYRAALDESVLGGDFYDVFPLPDSRVAFVIGDVSGKGLAAAVQTARVKFGIRGFASNDPAPDRVLERMRQALIQQGGYEGFVSVFLAVFDPRSRSLAFANAGHEPPMLRRADGRIEWLSRTATVLGISLPISDEVSAQSVTIKSNDQLLMYTDGLTEVRRSGKFLGRPGLLDAWEKLADLPPQESVAQLFEAVRDYARGQLKDDAAMLAIRFLPRRHPHADGADGRRDR